MIITANYSEMPNPGGLTDSELDILRSLWKQISEKQAKNALLTEYKNGHRAFKDLGISIPPQMKFTHAALDWPARAVDARTRKMIFEGFTLHGNADPFEMDEVFAQNNFEVELFAAFESSFTHCTSFITTTGGDVASGEPAVMVQARDAQWATGLWDQRRRQISAAITISELDEQSRVKSFTLFLPDSVIICSREDGGKWLVDRRPNLLGRVPVEQLPYKPSLSRPFGRSSINRESRYLTDAAIRTLVRAETSAEFFSSPQRYVLGAKESAFDGENRWSAITGRVLALDLNEEGETPTVGQFTQMSMQPHLEMYRQLANNFCAANNLPPSMLGIFTDNPTSAEAMQAAEWALSDEIERQWIIFGASLRRVFQNAVRIRDKRSDIDPELWDIQVKHTPCRYVSAQAASDYIVKVSSAVPEVAKTTVGLRRAGFDLNEIEEMRNEWRTDKSVNELVELGEQFRTLRFQQAARGVGRGEIDTTGTIETARKEA